ncbi:hypothetical protein O9993_17965 [Vibrio lentus]|nr:hypothetical protein [Vibrio lentus]
MKVIVCVELTAPALGAEPSTRFVSERNAWHCIDGWNISIGNGQRNG